MRKLKFLYFALLVAGILNITSCSNFKNKALEKIVEKMNESFPLDQGAMRIEKVKAGDEKIIMTMTILDETIIDIDQIASHKEEVKRNTIMSFSTDNPQLQGIRNLLVAADVDLEIIYQGAQTNKSCTYLITSEELKEAQKLPKATNEDVINGIVNLAKAQLPKQLDDVTIFENIDFDKKNVIYTLSYSKDYIDSLSAEEKDTLIMNIRNSKANVKEELRMTTQNDDGFGRLVSLCIKNGNGITYQYAINEADTIRFTFPDEELKEFFK